MGFREEVIIIIMLKGYEIKYLVIYYYIIY